MNKRQACMVIANSCWVVRALTKSIGASHANIIIIKQPYDSWNLSPGV